MIEKAEKRTERRSLNYYCCTSKWKTDVCQTMRERQVDDDKLTSCVNVHYLSA